MTANELRKKYLDFFVSKGHKIIPAAPLVPENDSTTLFTSSGMQPLIPYLLGKSHPEGRLLTNSQPSFRAQDIEEVGDNRHTTFFEMLGNWSLGDYFKKEQLSWLWEFLTEELKLPKEKLYVSIFAGNNEVPKDEESKKIWLSLGVAEDHIREYDVDKNWWSRSGPPDKMPAGEPGGPDSEVFFDFGEKLGIHEKSEYKSKECHPNCDCGRFLEIGNSVFMQYQKQQDGSLKEMTQKNVDFGGGLERLLAATNNDPDIYNTDVFKGAKKILESINTNGEDKNSLRIILDHIRASIFIINDKVSPSNKGAGYILRRLIRRSAVHAKLSNIDLEKLLYPLINNFCNIYSPVYPQLFKQQSVIEKIIKEELSKFEKTLERGLKELGKMPSFDLYQSYGFPPEIIEELMRSKGLEFDWEEFEQSLEKHKESSRTASAGMFKGGLGGQTETHKKYHSTTHLLHQALRDVLGDHVKQAGSNITADRLRFDFSHDKPLTDEQLKKAEDIINQKIQENLPVSSKTMPKNKALKLVTVAMFADRYPDQVSVYFIGNYSCEICAGPHVAKTRQIGKIEVSRQDSVGVGVRRIYLNLINGNKKNIQGTRSGARS